MENNSLHQNEASDTDYYIMSEGKAQIQFPTSNEVFYNPVQEFNRDISIVIIQAFINRLKTKYNGQVKFLEALAASGLRSIRYLKEIEGIDHAYINDIEEKAVKSIQNNLDLNKIDKSKYTILQKNAKYLLLDIAHQNKSDINSPFNNINIIDIDPYGSSNIFLESAIEAIQDGGLIAATCTDLAVLCGAHANSCYSKYGSFPAKGLDYCHEMAIRILLNFIALKAARHKKFIKPLVSFYSDFYIRVFVEVDSLKHSENDQLSNQTGFIHQCKNCNTFETFTNNELNKRIKQVNDDCPDCGSKFRRIGPVWLDSTVDYDFLLETEYELQSKELTLNTREKIKSMLFNLRNELNVPLFYSMPSLCKKLNLSIPKRNVFENAIISQGYSVTYSHTDPDGLKTNAPSELIWDILRSWSQIKQIKPDSLNPNTIRYKILSKPIKYNIDLNQPTYKQSNAKEKIKRYHQNPEKYWGPASKAGTKRNIMNKDLIEKLKSKSKNNNSRMYSTLSINNNSMYIYSFKKKEQILKFILKSVHL